MKHILSNPHNGSEVAHEGVTLVPGEEVHVRQHVGEMLLKYFPFLLLRAVPGDDKNVAKAKPVKIKGNLEWKHENTGTSDLPVADSVHHVAGAAAKKPVAKKKAAKKK